MIAQWRLCYTQLTPLEKKLCFSVIFTCVFLYQRLSNVIVFWHLLYSVKWQIERFVKAGCLCAFLKKKISFFFFFFDLFVPVLKPLLLHGKCICSPWGYNVYLSIFAQNVLYTVVPICNHGSDWFYLHYHVCMLWLVAEWQGPVWFVLLWWNEILLMC